MLIRINELADEEHALFEKASHGELTDEEHARLKQLGVTLDQRCDLLRQRRARRAVGLDPDDAGLRAESTVEH